MICLGKVSENEVNLERNGATSQEQVLLKLGESVRLAFSTSQIHARFARRHGRPTVFTSCHRCTIRILLHRLPPRLHLRHRRRGPHHVVRKARRTQHDLVLVQCRSSGPEKTRSIVLCLGAEMAAAAFADTASRARRGNPAEKHRRGEWHQQFLRRIRSPE